MSLLSINDIAIHNRRHNLKACYLGEGFGNFLDDLKQVKARDLLN
jgi:hypothetical protein